MAKKPSKFDGIIVQRIETAEGFVHCFDKNERPCWSADTTERVVLMEDLHKLGAGLYVGQLGWTMPGTTDGYKSVEVKFDSGEQLSVKTYMLERVVPDRADEIAAGFVASNRGTSFDADPAAALAAAYAEHAPYIDCEGHIQIGDGPEEFYAFTFPSLQRLAELEGKSTYPLKAGFTANPHLGAIARIRSMMVEQAGFPERPKVLLLLRCAAGRQFEAAVHRELRNRNRELAGAVGREWFNSTVEEVLEICRSVVVT